MEETKCIFKGKKSRCRSEPRKDLPLLICQQHLKQYYGLEVGYEQIDGVKHVSFTGGFLRPIFGYSTFSRNEVIIPTKHFLDLNIHTEDKDTKDSELLERFTLNNRIVETLREYANDYPDTMDHRHVVEMYRNFVADENADTDPIHTENLPVLQAIVEARKKHSEVFIRNQPVSRTLKDNLLYTDKQMALSIIDMKLSKNFQYLLNNILYSEFKIQAYGTSYLDMIPFNTTFIPNVGLVATEMIVHPLYLVIEGRSSGSPIYYNAHVGLIPKTIQPFKYTVKDVPKQYTLNEAWKGGTLC